MSNISWKLRDAVRQRLAKERGTVFKDPGGRVRVCLVYPNLYGLGMTNLGFQTVYHLFNRLDNCVAERAFVPDGGSLPEHAKSGSPLFSYESQTPVVEFDIIAFSLPFEEDYTNLPALFDLIGIPLKSDERSAASPLLIAGGVAVSLNPAPLAGIFDLFLIGEGEGSVERLVETFASGSQAGRKKGAALQAFDEIESVFVPSLYEWEYDGATVKEMRPLPGAKEKVRAAKNLNLDAFPIPQSFIVTPESEFKGTYLAEIERGCPRGCRFCAAGFLYLPPRWRDARSVKETVTKGIAMTGKAGLVGTAVSEYPWIKETVEAGIEAGGDVTLSSLRLDMLDARFMELLKKGGYQTVTLAPEAGSERMRAVVNKGLTDSEILDTARLVADAGFMKLKLYFLIGLPIETDADAAAIAELTAAIRGVFKKGSISLSINPFVPKPVTPFQWHRFEQAVVLQKRLDIIKRGLSKVSGVIMKAMSIKEAAGQAYISRADPRAGEFIVESAGRGLRSAMRKGGRLVEDSLYRDRPRDESLPWDFIDYGVKRQYLWAEYQKGLTLRQTPPCDLGSCYRCGVCVE
ncbi:MAG: radical SAM protein [Deltaproteobacteria bacterium]|nr:radical SAM protein [Deltaproteobacteria bacterium]